MIIYALIGCLIGLLILRFWYLGKHRRNFKIATTNFNDHHHEPLVIQKAKECLIIVTDPIGPARTGALACLIANQTISRFYETSPTNCAPVEFLKKACFFAHRQISEQINANSGGCSLCLIYISNKQLLYASVGDIAIYLGDEQLQQINQFDLYKYQLRTKVLEQKISEKQLLNNRLKNELTAYLGHENLKKINLTTTPLALAKSDKLVIATKDVYQAVTPLELEAITLDKGTLSQKLAKLEKTYHEQKPATAKRQLTATAVLLANFK